MVGRRRQIYGHPGYEPLVLLRYREILPKIPTDDCLSALCKKDAVQFHVQVVNKIL
jgi:hypothetical protein